MRASRAFILSLYALMCVVIVGVLPPNVAAQQKRARRQSAKAKNRIIKNVNAKNEAAIYQLTASKNFSSSIVAATSAASTNAASASAANVKNQTSTVVQSNGVDAQSIEIYDERVRAASTKLSRNSAIRRVRQHAVSRSTDKNGQTMTAAAITTPPVMPAAPPNNDRCQGAQNLSTPNLPVLSRTVDISDATTDGDPTVCELSEGGEPAHTVWYTFTPTESGSYVISTCQDAPTETNVLDTFLSVYTSSGGCNGTFTRLANVPRQGIQGCDDDGCDPDSSFQAVILTRLNAGTTYYILAGENDLSGDSVDSGGGSNLQVRISPAAQQAAPGQVLISEFRLSGNGEELDEFIELYNNTDAPVGIGFLQLRGIGLNSATGTRGLKDTTIFSKGTVLPARGYYLVANATSGYSLSNVAVPDVTPVNLEEEELVETDFDDKQGIALILAQPDGTLIKVVDKVGFANGSNAAFNFVEGTGLPAYQGVPDKEYSFVRRIVNGYPADTNNNAADFMLISTDGEPVGGLASVLGAPGPQSSKSARRQINSKGVDISLFDSSRSVGASPNLEINRNSSDSPNASVATLSLRRRFTNNTGKPLTQLRIRILFMSTKGTDAASGDGRLISSIGGKVTHSDGRQLDVAAVTLEDSPDQPLGGGINSTARIARITLSQPLPAVDNPATADIKENAIDLELRFGVNKNGVVRWYYSTEAATSEVIP